LIVRDFRGITHRSLQFFQALIWITAMLLLSCKSVKYHLCFGRFRTCWTESLFSTK
jgi:hypothetical protein